MSAKKTFLTSSSIASAILVVIIILTLTLAGSTQANATESLSSPVIIPMRVQEDSLLIVVVNNNEHRDNNLYLVALLNSQEYNAWKSKEPHDPSTSYDLPSQSILAQNVSRYMTLKRIYQADDYYLIIIRTQGNDPVSYFFSVAPYGLIFAIALFGFIFGLLSFIAFIAGSIVLLQYILRLIDKRNKEREKPMVTQTPPSTLEKRPSDESADKLSPSDQTANNPFPSLRETLEQAYTRVTVEELALILLGLFFVFLPIFGPDAYDPFPVFIAYLLFLLGPLLLLIASILYLSRAKQRKDLIAYLEIRRTASVSELQQFFSSDAKKIRQLILDAIRIDGVKLEIDEAFKVIKLIEAPIAATTKQEDVRSTNANVANSPNIIRCPFCAEETSPDSLFCSQCGASLVPPK